MKPFPRSFCATWVPLILLAGCAHGADLPQLTTQVSALPVTSQAEKWKKVVLEVALERAGQSGDGDYASALLNDVQAALATPAAQLATVTPNPPFISALKPVPVTKGNPFIDGMVQGVQKDLKRPDLEFVKATPTVSAFSKLPSFYSVRNIGAQMEALLWLFANPASPLKDDSAILRLLLRRSLAYVDTLDTQAPKIQAGQELLDDFAIAPASSALREFAQLYPNLILPSQKKQWDAGMKNAASAMFGKADGRDGRYANIDVALAFELANFGLYFGEQKWLGQAKFLVDAQKKNLYPDGAVSYIWSQSESPSYQGVLGAYLRRYQKLMGDATSREILAGMNPYERVTGRLPDWWTAPSWKQQWNQGGNLPSQTLPQIPGDNRRWENARLNIEDFTGKVDYQPLPDDFTVLDRNVLGPRAWYDRWNYVATLRPIPNTEPGHSTLMGAQIAAPDNRLNAALMGIYPRVGFVNPRTKKDDFAFLTSDMKAALTMGREWSALSASYDLASYGSSSKGQVAPGWQGRQIWLGLPDRIIGWLAVVPTQENAAANELGAIVRLGTGGTVVGDPQTLKTLAPNQFGYGDLKINVLAHNFAELAPVVVPFRLPNNPATELTFKTAKPTVPAFVVVELRPAWSVGQAKATPISANGLSGLRVEVGAKKFTIWANFGATAATGDLAGAGSLHRSQNPATLTGVSIAPTKPAPAKITLAPNEHAVLVESDEAGDHQKGWTNFPEMLAQVKP